MTFPAPSLVSDSFDNRVTLADFEYHRIASQIQHEKVQAAITAFLLNVCSKEDDLGTYTVQYIKQLLVARGLISFPFDALSHIPEDARTLQVNHMPWSFPDLKRELERLGVYPIMHYNILCIPETRVAVIGSSNPEACRHIASCVHGLTEDSAGELLMPPLEVVPVSSVRLDELWQEMPGNCFLFLPNGESKWGTECFQEAIPLVAASSLPDCNVDSNVNKVVERMRVADSRSDSDALGNHNLRVAQHEHTSGNIASDRCEADDHTALRLSSTNDEIASVETLLCHLQEKKEVEKEQEPEDKTLQLLLKLMRE